MFIVQDINLKTQKPKATVETLSLRGEIPLKNLRAHNNI